MSEDTVSKDGTDGLVTFSVEVTSSGHPYMKSDPDGDYVTRSQAESEIRKVCKYAEELLAAVTKERDHWKEYSSGQGKLIESGVFVTNDEYVRLTALEADNAALTSEKQSMLNAMGDMANSNKKLKAKLAAAQKTLEATHEAISEYYRYQTGGDMRGSYDGKPERYALWKAMYQARAVLGGKPS